MDKLIDIFCHIPSLLLKVFDPDYSQQIQLPDLEEEEDSFKQTYKTADLKKLESLLDQNSLFLKNFDKIIEISRKILIENKSNHLIENLFFILESSIQSFSVKTQKDMSQKDSELISQNKIFIELEKLLELYEESKKYIEKKNTARDSLIEGNLKLVVSVAKKHYNTRLKVAFIDLIQEGNIGLFKAIDKFDVSKGYRFSTYATWWIRQTVSRYTVNHSRTIRIPANMVNLIVKINRSERAFLQENGFEPTPAVIAEKLDISPQKVRAMKKMANQTISLQSISLNDSTKTELLESMPDPSVETPAEKAERSSLKKTINLVLDSLDDREKSILMHRYGINNTEILSLRKLAAKYNLSKERIRQIEKRVLEKLRDNNKTSLLYGYGK
ncbi:MAG: sigma-70 family RNA polymerase sigma factor [Verrucomicrobiota bacterium]|nr:sigma-70 family RNA polymerase sigma factor [Verrucomicrobiota bacterium]